MNDVLEGLRDGFAERAGELLKRHGDIEETTSYDDARRLGYDAAAAALAPLLWRAAVGERWETTEAAEFLGVTRQALHKRCRTGTVLGLPGRGTTSYPIWQFDLDHHQVRPQVAQILEAFRRAVDPLDPLIVASWATTTQPELGMAPDEWRGRSCGVSVPLPPDDPLELVDFPSREVPASYRYARIHREHHEPEWFCSCGQCRFDPPAGSDIGTCYLSGHRLGAFVEKFGRYRLIPQSLVDLHLLSELALPSPIKVADATDRTIVGRWGLTAGLWADGNYAVSQVWAQRLFQAGFAGIWYPAAHDVQGHLHSLALFGKQGYQPNAFISYGSDSIGVDLCDEAYDKFDIEVLPTTAI